MQARVLGLAASALILAYGTIGASAQDQVTPQPDQQQTQSRAAGQDLRQPQDLRRDTGQNMGQQGMGQEMGQQEMGQQEMGQGHGMGQAMGQQDEATTGQGRLMPEGMPGRGMMDRGMMPRGMMGRGMMAGGMRGCPPIMSRIIFALMDADGDGTVSLQEFEAAHERIFKAMDANKDGQLTEDEMLAFMQGITRSTPQQ